MKNITIGLLPLYIKLYDDSCPELRPHVEKFYNDTVKLLEGRGFKVLTAPVCRIKPEFASAVKSFEQGGAEVLITLHLAYSPSLESAEVLAKTELPLIVLDTTPDYVFDTTVKSEIIDYNHGIHGVMDMCNLLVRNGKHFEIFAGHAEKSRVIDRVCNAVYGAVMANAMKTARVGTFGAPFDGMGDFAIPFDKLKADIGMTAMTVDPSELSPVSPERVASEYEKDCAENDMNGVTFESYKGCETVALSIRDLIEKYRLTAFSMSFLATKAGTAFDYIPFTEACKAMKRGTGYAGEGDVLTAAYVGSLLSVHDEASFCEIFCPDWQGDSLFVSHMGEYNPNCTATKCKYYVRPFPYTDAGEPTVMLAPFKPGRVIFTCLAPLAEGYRMIVTEGKMLPVPAGTDFDTSVRGWFKPNMPITEFLPEYSKAGGIHHAALIYDADVATMRAYAGYMGWEFTVI